MVGVSEDEREFERNSVMRAENACMKRNIAELGAEIKALLEERKIFISDNERLKMLYEIEREKNAKLQRGLDAVQGLMDESDGVYGLHTNGDGADWEELLTGGRYEDWLNDFSIAMDHEVAR